MIFDKEATDNRQLYFQIVLSNWVRRFFYRYKLIIVADEVIMDHYLLFIRVKSSRALEIKHGSFKGKGKELQMKRPGAFLGLFLYFCQPANLASHF